MRAAPEYRRLCKNGDRRTVIETMDICGPCFAALIMPSHTPPKMRRIPVRRGICCHCGQVRNLTGRDLCESKCARQGLDYPVVRGRGRRKAAS